MTSQVAESGTGPMPVEALRGVRAYATPGWPGPIDLFLDGNEGVEPDAAAVDRLGDAGTDVLRRYPSTRELEARIAEDHGVDASRVLVTAGADEAIDRVCRAMLGPDRSLVVPTPTFEMLPRYARLTGAAVGSPAWDDGPFPLDAVLGAIDSTTGVVGLVSPNNPTGLAISSEVLERVSAAASDAVVLLDHAYVEFADEDLTSAALRLPNVVVTRTMSKAWGLAGLRVGYAVGAADVIGWLRPAGGPYSVAGPSLAIASDLLDRGRGDVDGFVGRVARDRGVIAEAARRVGGRPTASQGNFVFARFGDAAWTRDALAGLGVKVRGYPSVAGLGDALRITCPGDAGAAGRVVAGLEAALRPEAMLFDLDGVLVDVSGSYRAAIRAAAATCGVEVTPEQIGRMKARGNANNDWDVTLRLLTEAGVETTRDAVIERFEAAYQGVDGQPGLKATERAIIDRAWLERVRTSLPMGIVTGRPRADAMEALERFGIADLFDAILCMEDGPSKPEPDVVRVCMDRLGVKRAWMIGDTVDDIRAARAAGVVPIGVVPPGEHAEVARGALAGAGAARVLAVVDGLAAMLEGVAR